ncbi:MAG TPA: nuclear transport factor 2 family protein [Gammaproteobacteria bacterium]
MEHPELAAFCSDWLAAWTGNRPERLRSFYTEDAYYADPGRPQGLRGAELLPYFRKLLAKNPDWAWQAEEILPTAKGFCLKWRACIPTDGREVEVAGLDIVELSDGKISRNEVFFDASVLAKRP